MHSVYPWEVGHIVNLSVYALKSRFQSLLKPCRNRLIQWGISPNQITITTCILCVVYSLLLIYPPLTSILLLLLPLFMFIRMALNALDGMVAHKIKNQTSLGLVLNEVTDIVSDVFLFGAFLYLFANHHSLNMVLWLLLIFLALLSEFISLAVYQVNQIRSHSGPFGKSDRAVYLALLAFFLWIFPEIITWYSLFLSAYILLGLLLSSLTIYNRFMSLYDSKPVNE